MKQSHVFSDRPINPAIQRSALSGIILRPYGQGWKTLRCITQQALCGFGVGKTSLAEKIALEIHAASSVTNENASEPMDIRPIVQKITGNILYSIVFGKRFDFNDPGFETIKRMTYMGFQGWPLSLARYVPQWVTRIIKPLMPHLRRRGKIRTHCNVCQ